VSDLEAVICSECERWAHWSRCETLLGSGGVARCSDCQEERWLAESEEEEEL